MTKIFLAALVLFLICQAAPAEDEWQKFQSRHFVVYYKEAPESFAETVAETAEQLYEEIAESLGFTRYHGWSYDNRATIYIYRDHEEYTSYARRLRWSHGLANARIKEIRTYPSAHGFFDSTLPHELGHIIFREFVGLDANLPLWMDEGVAMFQEKAKRWGANKAVKKAIEDDMFIPLEELAAMRFTAETSDEIVNIFYAEAASVVYYMIVEQGESRFENFCRKLSDGMSFAEALDRAYPRFKGISDLNRQWVEYLKSQ